jgi:hypothetical protein
LSVISDVKRKLVMKELLRLFLTKRIFLKTRPASSLSTIPRNRFSGL